MILGYLPVYIAREFYPFEFLNTSNDDESIKAVLEKRAEISMSDPFMFNEVDYGKVRVISGFITRPFIHLITFNPFLKDLHGKTMVTYPPPSTTYHLALRLKEKYKLNLIKTPFNTELGPMLTQEADIGLIYDPNYTQAVKNRAIVLDSFIKMPFAFTGFCSLSPRRKHEKFFKAVKKGIEVFYKDQEKTLEVAKKYFPLKEEILRKAIQNLRDAKMYSLSFTKTEVENAFKLRNLNIGKYKKYLIGDANPY